MTGFGKDCDMEEISVLITQAQAGDKMARKVLIEENLGLVRSIVRRFVGRGVEAEDLFQIGTIGLMKAVDRFALEYNVKFSTYAVPMITGEIKRFLRDDGPIKISRTLKENALKVRVARQRLQNVNGREPTVEELAAEAGLDAEELLLAMEADMPVESIYASVYQSDGSEVYLVDTVAGQAGDGTGKSRVHAGARDSDDPEKEALLNHMLLEQLLGELGEEERHLIRLRYYQSKTQVEAARVLGISQVQVSRLEKKILLRMRELCG